MLGRWLLIPFLAALALAANLRLYLKDGTYQVVREYQAQADRVRFYSVERSEWEEIPLDLVDLKRTESEAAARKADIEKEAKAVSEEDAAERELKNEVARIPQDPGAYWVEGGQAKVMKAAESNVRTNKGRSVLKRLAPIPVVSGKGTVELDGARSSTVFTNPEQEFYLQLSQAQRFGIARLTVKGNVRIVENLTIMPVTNEVEEAGGSGSHAPARAGRRPLQDLAEGAPVPRRIRRSGVHRQEDQHAGVGLRHRQEALTGPAPSRRRALWENTR